MRLYDSHPGLVFCFNNPVSNWRLKPALIFSVRSDGSVLHQATVSLAVSLVGRFQSPLATDLSPLTRAAPAYSEMGGIQIGNAPSSMLP